MAFYAQYVKQTDFDNELFSDLHKTHFLETSKEFIILWEKKLNPASVVLLVLLSNNECLWDLFTAGMYLFPSERKLEVEKHETKSEDF